MKNMRRLAVAGTAAALALALSACGGANSGGGDSNANELVMSSWNVDKVSEFTLLAKAFEKSHKGVHVKLKEYSIKDYDTQLVADLSAGAGPDVYPLKSLSRYAYFVENNQLSDITDVAKKYVDSKTVNMKPFDYKGKYYAMPYRQDAFVLYYNKDLFKKAGIPFPDGTWTWDKFYEVSKQLTEKLKGASPSFRGAYIHPWNLWPNFAAAQTPGASYLSGNLDFTKKYYDIGTKLQDNGYAESYANAATQKLSYQGQFGKQRTAMMPMGTWYVAVLVQQQKKGEADKFEWGVAPVPQYSSDTADKPITYGGPTAIGMNPRLSGAKVKLAKEFLTFISSEEASKVLAEYGTLPANLTESVLDTYLHIPGMPQDKLMRETLQKEEIRPEMPVSPITSDIMAVVSDLNATIMNKNKSVDEAIAQANQKLQSKKLFEKN